MNKSLLTRGLAIGMICPMAFLSACGKKNETVSEDKVATEAVIDRDHVYTMDDLVLPLEGDINVNGFCSGKDGIYTLVNTYGGEESKTAILKISYEDGEVAEVPIPATENVYYENLECDDDGNLYLIKTEYSDEYFDEEYSDDVVEEGTVAVAEDGESSSDDEAAGDVGDGTDAEAEDGESSSKDDESSTYGEAAGDGEKSSGAAEGDVEDSSEDAGNDGEDSEDEVVYDEESSASLKLAKFSPEGGMLWEVPLTDEDSKRYVQSMKYVDGKGILTCCNGEFSLYNENTGEGKSLFTRHEESDDDYYYASLYRVKSGDVYISEEDWSNDGRSKIIKLNKDTMQFEDETELPENVYGGSSLQPGNAYDFYINNNSNIEAFNLGDDKPELICDFTASDIMVDYLNYFTDTPDGKLLIVANQDEGGCLISSLTKVDPSQVVEKETLTLGTVYIPQTIRKQVVEFNRTNDKYRIKIVDYSDVDAGDTGDAYFDAASKLGLDLTQGQGPDMLVIDYSMPFESYAKKGALEPLDPYFDADEDISIEDFLQNVIDSCRVDGKIYTLMPSFHIETCVAAKKKVGGEKVTISNYQDVCKNNGIDPKLGMGSMTIESAGELYSTVGMQFLDYENGTCSFDSQGFIDLLKFIKEFPKDQESMGIDYEEFESYYRENKSLLLDYYISSFDDYQVLKKGYFGEDILFNGFPTADGGESFISPFMQIAMNSDCKHKDVAWEFMKSFMTDEYQKSVEWSFPIKESALLAMAEKAQEKPYYIDSEGNKVETSSSWTIGDIDVEIEELSKEETEELVDFVKSVTHTAFYEQHIIDIIQEEAQAFYEDQKTAEEVANIIQSRISIYMGENS
ncbi:ABC transporter substrate-binding protein [Butyrivibrio sp. VCD2006]|uniref:ABC transporter substrate-binding protein n=1 Tax=Butyrivibrio sp. VCD2006 TaxID=1280664 RepID=UPI0004096B56|nr:extracellular solute-binding protein [Butyrivibrio sp. VCD2006]